MTIVLQHYKVKRERLPLVWLGEYHLVELLHQTLWFWCDIQIGVVINERDHHFSSLHHKSFDTFSSCHLVIAMHLMCLNDEKCGTLNHWATMYFNMNTNCITLRIKLVEGEKYQWSTLSTLGGGRRDPMWLGKVKWSMRLWAFLYVNIV